MIHWPPDNRAIAYRGPWRERLAHVTLITMPDDSREPEMIASHRQSLPAQRDSITHKFAIMGHEGYLTIGLFENGDPGEIFIKMSKAGSTLGGLVQAYCRAFSLALQFGLPVHEAVNRFKGMRFEPMGHTSNPEIPEALSIVDYVARYIELHFLHDQDSLR